MLRIAKNDISLIPWVLTRWTNCFDQETSHSVTPENTGQASLMDTMVNDREKLQRCFYGNKPIVVDILPRGSKCLVLLLLKFNFYTFTELYLLVVLYEHELVCWWIYIYVWLIANNGVTYCYREIGVSVTVILAIRHLKERRYNLPI